MCTENSDSDVLVVQPADERVRYDVPDRLNRTRQRCILVQGTMCSRFIIIPSIGAQDPAQVLFTEYYDVINALAPD